MVDGIVNYMKKQAGDSAKKLADMAAVEKFIDDVEHSIIGELWGGWNVRMGEELIGWERGWK